MPFQKSMKSTVFNPKGVIFDLDGTLVDSFKDIATALNRTREDYGLPPLPYESVKEQVGSGSAHLVRTLVPLPEADFQEAFDAYLRYYEAHILDETTLLDGVLSVLDRFKDRFLGVVTNKNHHLAILVLEGLGVMDRFSVVLGGDSLPQKKPDPLPLFTVLNKWGIKPGEALMVGDGLHDIEAGKSAGMITVAVTTGVEPRETLQATYPDRLLSSLDEMLVEFE